MYIHKWCTCVYMHWWALQSRGGALVDQPLQRWPTGRSSSPGGGQLLDTSSLEVYKHIQIYVCVYTYICSIYICTNTRVGSPFQGRCAGGSAIPGVAHWWVLRYVYKYIYTHWWTLHFRGGTLLNQPLQRWHTGGSSTPGGGELLDTSPEVESPPMCIYICILEDPPVGLRSTSAPPLKWRVHQCVYIYVYMCSG